ncbi:hypothetical protein DYI37_08025 [Fulvimarina endophytica]|uniref:Uncharacterized protein n=2 Tax=Fulvimarina endophytica TaxID=2293836 RepID=A0A371X4Z6_9HYPH|nr:hypothetical protein DYI37_08025 [Fulvimarina endophytica]
MVGAVRLVNTIEVTKIVRGEDGVYRYGPEITFEHRRVPRTLVRKSEDGNGDGLRRISRVCEEFHLSAKAAKAQEVNETWSLNLSFMPLAQRRTEVLKLLKSVDKLPRFIFEDHADFEGEFSDPGRRRAASDEEAWNAIASASKRYPYVMERVFVAVLGGGDVAPYREFEDGKVEKVKNSRELSLVAGLVEDRERARASVMQSPRLMKRYEQTGEGRLYRRTLPDAPMIHLHVEVAQHAPIHLALAVDQALSGAGARHETWLGKPVADYADYLFEQHMVASNDRREEDELSPPTLGGDAADRLVQPGGIEWEIGRYDEDDPDDRD